MPQYAYRAINDRGRSVRGKINAAHDNDLFRQLRTIGLELVDARLVQERRLAVVLAPKVRIRDQIQLCLHLYQLQNAGVPLIDGLADVRDSTENARLRDILAEIYRDVSEGAALSEAFGRHKPFGQVFTSLIAAGETSGNLNDSFAQLVKHLKWTEAVSAKIKKATRYPAVIMVMMAALFFFMMTMVVPEVVGFLRGTGIELPFVTRTLIATSDYVQTRWYVLLIVPVAVVFVLRGLIKTSPGFAYGVDALLLRLPVIGTLISKVSLSRFAHFFATMFASGVPLLQCLETAQKVVSNRVLSTALEQVREAVQTGVSLSAAMQRSGQFPSLVVRMVRVGEESGSLSQTLANVTDFYDRDVDETVDTVVAMAEPGLTVAAGLLMAWIIAGVFGPLYDSFGNLGG
jgi:type IV pilus assembly protein PilC